MRVARREAHQISNGVAVGSPVLRAMLAFPPNQGEGSSNSWRGTRVVSWEGNDVHGGLKY